jgi:flagellar biosynthesis protein FlhF
MHVHTFKARSLQEALRRVRDELGPEASVLHTREVGSSWSRWLVGSQIEVTASAEACIPSQLPAIGVEAPSVLPAELFDFRQKFREDLCHLADDESSLVELLSRAPNVGHASRLSIGRDNRASCPAEAVEIPIADPIRVVPDSRTVVALVGPTGVGKTTTIAKLAAHYRLRERCRVGLITVDTYRIAAVEQLKTYAEIMDLPLEVVATPREMRAAVERLADTDLVLIDTAGRSPRDAVRLNELRRLLGDSQADEVHLVLSAVAGPESFDVAAGAFSTAGASALILTKLDEAAALDWLPTLLNRHRLPLSYTTSGQNVPDDIQQATVAQLVGLLANHDDRDMERRRDRETERQNDALRPSVPPSLRPSV